MYKLAVWCRQGSALWVALFIRGPREEVGCLETYGGILHEWQYLV